MKLSVIIASHNRSGSLLNFLNQIVRQVVPEEVEWEVLIVDNNSSDDTRSTVSPFTKKDAKRFRYFFEKRPGKSVALNTGVREATGEILMFTDDDCIPDSLWLANAAHEFASDPSLGVVGGRVELFDGQHRPVSVRSYLERTLICSRDQVFLFLIGANMAIHRRVFDVVRDFDPFLGPGSKIGAVMEDIDFLYRVYREKFKMLYSPDVLVYHNHGRTSEADIRALTHRYVVGRGAFYCKHIFAGDHGILRMAYWEVSSLLKSCFKELLAGKGIHDQRRLLWALFVGAMRRLTWNQSVRKI
jgi:hypothetical protein